MSQQPFISHSHPLIGLAERAAVDGVLAAGRLGPGPEGAALEVEFADRLVHGRTCVATSSGTAAAHLALLACGIGPGDEVIVPSFTFAATANVVAITGATPVFADIDPATFCLDPAHVETLISDRTRAIMPVHQFGHPAAMPQLQALAAEHDVSLYEDAAQAPGAAIGDHAVGTFGKWAMFSLTPGMNLTAGGGGIVAGDASLAHRIKLLRNQGTVEPFRNEIVGLNCQLSDLHAAIGRVQLSRLGDWTNRRREIAAHYDQQLRAVVTPPVADGVTHVYHQYTIRVPQRDRFAQVLADEHGIGTGIYYPVPVHALAAYGRELDLPHTMQAAAEALSLPVHPGLSDDDVERVIAAVNAVAAAGG